MLPQRPLLAAIAASALAPHALPAHERATRAADAEAVYLEHCSQCHGESGDGKGTQELERPARSFLDGGFSYGNTRRAVVRSLVHGIPGTPMPAFEETLTQEQLEAVADYVIDLGPPGTIVEPGASVLAVGDTPVVVQGMLPPAKEGEFRTPRGLLVGFPNGTTFQYGQADGALLAVRQGEFVDRRDWRERGGRALDPLGAIVWTPAPDAEPNAEIVHGADRATLARPIKRTEVKAGRVWLHFDLVDADGTHRGGGQEVLDFITVDGIPVPVRAVVIASGTDDVAFRPIQWPPVATVGDDPSTFVVGRVEDGVLAVDPGRSPNLRVYVHANEWSDALGAALLESMGKKD
ncbi:MAG: c-type cytochrome [Planctomycetota bacterium]